MLIKAQALTNRPNPYLTQLYAELRTLGAQVVPMSSRSSLAKPGNIIHLHWPEALVASRSRQKALLYSQAWLAYMRVSMMLGARLVYTVHNIRHHEKVHDDLQKRVLDFVLKNCTSWISLSEVAKEEVLSTYPELAGKLHRVIPHGHYRAAYPNSVAREEARRELGIGPAAKVLLLFGSLRGYKGIEEMVELMKQPELSGEEYVLLIAGRASNPEELRQIESKKIRVFPDYIPDDKVQVFYGAADLAVMPYRNILNSGAALLALSFDTPILAPRMGSLIELAEDIGSDYVELFSGDLTAEQVKSCVDRACLQPKHRIPMPKYEWPEIGRQTYELFKETLATPR